MPKFSCCYANPTDITQCVDCVDSRGCIENVVNTWQRRARDAGVPVCSQYKNLMDNIKTDPEYRSFKSQNAHLVNMLNEVPLIRGCIDLVQQTGIPSALNPDPNKNLLAPYMPLHAPWPQMQNLPTMQSPDVPESIKDPGTYRYPFETYPLGIGGRCLRAFIFYSLFAYLVYVLLRR